MDWNKVSFLKASNIRKNILNLLNDRPFSPSELSKKLKKNKSQITRAIKELQSQNLIECLTPKIKKGKLYSSKKEGKVILKYL